ncbi:MAG: hypothetical protein O6944_09650 [Gammaproteobacteria bacterium]|nr:hypothetical protein [Gammaproteobacteria bacterium]
MKTYILSAWRPARYRGLGMQQLIMLALSNLVIETIAGRWLLWQLRHVYAIAQGDPNTSVPAQWLVVLGIHLRKGAITADYALRLEKAQALQAKYLHHQILIGGCGLRTLP